MPTSATQKKTAEKKVATTATSNKRSSSSAKKGVSSKPKTTSKTKKTNKDLFAVIETGGKQYVVSEGDLVKVEKLDVAQGEKVVFDKVLLVDDGSTTSIGTPYISGAKVTGLVEKVGRDKKVDVVKYKSKSRYHKRYGHRQHFSQIRVESIM